MEHGSETLLEGSLIDIATQRSISTWEFGEASIPVSYRRHGRSSGMCLCPLYGKWNGGQRRLSLYGTGEINKTFAQHDPTRNDREGEDMAAAAVWEEHEGLHR